MHVCVGECRETSTYTVKNNGTNGQTEERNTDGMSEREGRRTRGNDDDGDETRSERTWERRKGAWRSNT